MMIRTTARLALIMVADRAALDSFVYAWSQALEMADGAFPAYRSRAPTRPAVPRRHANKQGRGATTTFAGFITDAIVTAAGG